MGRSAKPEYVKKAQEQQLLFAELFGQNEYDEFCIESPEGRKKLEALLAVTFHQTPVKGAGDGENIWDKTFNVLDEDGKRSVADWIDFIEAESKRDVKNQRQTSGKLRMGIVFVSLMFDLFDEEVTITVEPHPLIRLHLPDNTLRFIDWHKRVYPSWDGYLRTNEMPMCHFLYPEGGRYHRSDGRTPALWYVLSSSANLSSKAVRLVDKASAVLGVVGLGAGLAASAFTPAAPLLLPAAVASAVSSSWVFTRSSHRLHDLRTHRQTLNPRDKRAGAAWLGVGISIVSLGLSLRVVKGSMKARAANSLASEQPPQTSQLRPANRSLTALDITSAIAGGNIFIRELEKTVAICRKDEITQEEMNELMLMHFLYTKSMWPQYVLNGLYAVVEHGPGVYERVVNAFTKLDEGGLKREAERVVRAYEARRAEAEEGIGTSASFFSPFVRDIIWSFLFEIFEPFKLNKELFNRVFSLCLSITDHLLHLRQMVLQGEWKLAVEFLVKTFIVVRDELENVSLQSLENLNEDGRLRIAEKMSTVPDLHRTGLPSYSLPPVGDNRLTNYSRFLFDDETTLDEIINSHSMKIGGFVFEVTITEIITIKIFPEN